MENKQHWLITAAKTENVNDFLKDSIVYQFIGATGNILKESGLTDSEKGKQMTSLFDNYETAMKIVKDRRGI